MKHTFSSESLYMLNENCTLEKFLDNIDPEYKKVVPNHWLQFDRPSRSAQYVVSTILLLICLIANTNQVLVFIAYGR